MKKIISLFIICIGIILIFIGVFIQVPGNHLTTYSLLDGTDDYSSIDEYVGGDAYNYIIGASLVAGKISGIIVSKSIFIAIGCLIFCVGLIYFSISMNDSSKIENYTIKTTPVNITDSTEDSIDQQEH